MKKLFASLVGAAAMALCGMVCSASMIPAQGQGQIGYSSVVLCSSISLRQEPDVNAAALDTLSYGDSVIVMRQENGWAQVALGDSEDSGTGWVKEDFLAVDPAWYLTDEDIPVYAWNDTSAPKVAVLEKGTDLPILKDDGEWIVVSLRGAAGWIHQPDRTVVEASAAQSAGSSESSSSGETTQDAQTDAQTGWFTVYAKDGSTVNIHPTVGAMYEDAQGRTYVKQDDEGIYYCIPTDTTYAIEPGIWTGATYGENQFPDEQEWNGGEYGENQFPDENPDDDGVNVEA